MIATTEKQAKRMTIGQLAKCSEVNIETIRYYERRGLLQQPPRTPSNYRIYYDDSVKRILFIKRAKKIGFTLAEIIELLTVLEESTDLCVDLCKIIEFKIRDINRSILLQTTRVESLYKFLSECSSKDSRENCPFLKALDTGNGIE